MGQPPWKIPGRRLSLNRLDVSSHQMKPRTRAFLTPRPLSPSSLSPDSGVPESLRGLWFHLHEVGKLLPCVGRGRSPLLPISHLDHNTSFLNLVHLDTMASLLAKRVLLLHPTHWWGSYLESTDRWNHSPTWPSTVHRIDFANWSAVPPRMDTIAPCDPHLTTKMHLFHSSSPLHSGYHSVCLTLSFNKGIQALHHLFHWHVFSTLVSGCQPCLCTWHVFFFFLSNTDAWRLWTNWSPWDSNIGIFAVKCSWAKNLSSELMSSTSNPWSPQCSHTRRTPLSNPLVCVHLVSCP